MKTGASHISLQDTLLEEQDIVDERDYFVQRAMQNLKIINVVALGSVQGDVEIDLAKIRVYCDANSIKTATMNRFPSLNLVVNGATVILFKNGKIIFTGTKSLPALKKVAQDLEALLDDFNGTPGTVIDVQIQNMVAMTSCHHFVDLENMCLNCADLIYEPEQFPAAISKKMDRPGVFLIFSNSKLICLGLKSRKQIEQEVERFLNVLYPFARKNLD